MRKTLGLQWFLAEDWRRGRPTWFPTPKICFQHPEKTGTKQSTALLTQILTAHFFRWTRIKILICAASPHSPPHRPFSLHSAATDSLHHALRRILPSRSCSISVHTSSLSLFHNSLSRRNSRRSLSSVSPYFIALCPLLNSLYKSSHLLASLPVSVSPPHPLPLPARGVSLYH